MADEARKPEEDDEDAPRTSMEEHKATYEAFLNLMKWGVVVVALLLIGMAIFLT